MKVKDLDALVLKEIGGSPEDMFLIPAQVIRKFSDLQIVRLPDSGASRILVDHIKEHLFDEPLK